MQSNQYPLITISLGLTYKRTRSSDPSIQGTEHLLTATTYRVTLDFIPIISSVLLQSLNSVVELHC